MRNGGQRGKCAEEKLTKRERGEREGKREREREREGGEREGGRERERER